MKAHPLPVHTFVPTGATFIINLEVSICTLVHKYISLSFRLFHLRNSLAHLLQEDLLLVWWVVDEGYREITGLCRKFIDGCLGPEAQEGAMVGEAFRSCEVNVGNGFLVVFWRLLGSNERANRSENTH